MLLASIIAHLFGTQESFSFIHIKLELTDNLHARNANDITDHLQAGFKQNSKDGFIFSFSLCGDSMNPGALTKPS